MSPSSLMLNISQMMKNDEMQRSCLVHLSFGKYFLIHQYSIRR